MNYYFELVNVLNYERVLIEELGEEAGELFIDEVFTISPILDLDEELGELPDIKDRIRFLAKYIEKNFGGTHYEGPADITPLN